MVQYTTDALKKAVNDYSAVVALCLHDKLGFGHERAKKFLTAVGDMFADVQDKRLSIDDIKATLDKEIGVQIK
jgi:hypothetical protein